MRMVEESGERTKKKKRFDEILYIAIEAIIDKRGYIDNLRTKEIYICTGMDDDVGWNRIYLPIKMSCKSGAISPLLVFLSL